MKNILLLLILIATCDAFAQFSSTTTIKADEIKNNSSSNIVLNPTSDVIFLNATGLTLPYFDSNGELKSSTVTKTELDKLSGTSGDLVDTGSSQTIVGEKTFTGKMTAQSITTGFKPCPVMNEAQRNAIATPSLGDCITNSNTNKLNVFDGSVWKSAGGGLDKWVTSNSYQVDDVVIENDELYICLNDHTSGTFATDLSNGEWKKISHFINASDDSNDFRIKDIKSPNLLMTKIDDDKALIETGNKNILENPSFQHQTTATGWTVTGVTASDETSDIDGGLKAIKFITSGDTGSLVQDSTLNINSLADGAYGSLTVRAKNNANGAQVCFRQAGNNSICQPLLTDNKWRTYHFPSVLFGATSNGVGIEWDNSTGTTIIGSAVLQLDNPVVQVAQAQIAGESFFAPTASCLWTRTSTTLGAFSTVSACPAPTISYQNIGEWQTIDADLPRQTINNLPSGIYRMTAYVTNYLSSVFRSSLAITDGATTCQSQQVNQTTGATNQVVSCIFNYSESGNRVFEILGNSAGGTLNISNDIVAHGTGLKFILEYYPPPTEVIASRCENPIDCETVFSAKVSITGVVSDENLDWINGNCTGSTPYTCTFKSGVFSAAPNCYTTPSIDPGSSISASISSVSSSSVVVATDNTAGAANLPFNLICQRQGEDYKRAKINYQLAQLKASNVDGGNDFGAGRKMKTCQYAFGGAGSLASQTRCTTSPCTEYFDSCDALSAPTRSGTGDYRNLSIANGTFKASSLIKCECEAYTTGGGKCLTTSLSTDKQATNANGGYSFAVATAISNGAFTDAHVTISCTAEAP